MELRGSDLALVRDQLGREPLTRFSVLVRCGDGHPLAIRNHPVDLEGNPFPTLYWLTCPEAVRAVSRLEAEGWIKRLDERAAAEPELGEALDRAHAEYARERARLAPEAGGGGGVGGTRVGIKCLHAQYANHLAGGEDPIGAWVAERIEPVHPGAGRGGRVAAVDMGTNSIRLLVLGPGRTGPVELARDMVITRLGQGVDRERRLDPGALDRTLDVLARYARRARALGTERIRVGATSAVRDVADRGLLEQGVASICGVGPEVLTGEREAGLSFLGATGRLEVDRPVLVFDIGGGSTELAHGSERVDAAISLDVGSVRITERVRPSDPPTQADRAEMRRLAASALGSASPSIPAARTAVGVAGTVTTIQALALGLDRYDPERIHGTFLARSEAERVSAWLGGMTTAERRALPVMAPGREDVIVAGCAILAEILQRWGPEGCVVSEHDILDGLAVEMLGAG